MLLRLQPRTRDEQTAQLQIRYSRAQGSGAAYSGELVLTTTPPAPSWNRYHPAR
jgi:hypothetical protein